MIYYFTIIILMISVFDSKILGEKFRQPLSNGTKVIDYCNYPCQLSNGTVLDVNNYLCERSLRKSQAKSEQCM